MKELLKRAIPRAVLATIACAGSVLLPACRAVAYGGYNRYSSAPPSWPYIVAIIVFIVAAAIFGMTKYGRQVFRRGRGMDMWNPEGGEVPGSLTVSAPMKKAKGINDCPQCGLPIEPGMTKCPKCHWNFHSFQVQAPPGRQSVNPADLAGAGFTAVTMAPLGAAEMLSRPAPAPAGTPAGTAVSPGSPDGTRSAVPVAPGESPAGPTGVVQRDIVIDGVVAFREGERVHVEGESPDPARPEYKYVVSSRVMNRRFRLSDMDIFT